ncbi:MAG: DUF1566 domain-containing protein [Mariprofundaceae bacterium]
MNGSKYLHQGMLRRGVRNFFALSLLFLVLLSGNQAFADQKEQVNEKPTMPASASSADFDDDKARFDSDDKATRETLKIDAHRRHRHRSDDQQERWAETDESRNGRSTDHVNRATRITATETDHDDVLPMASIASGSVVEGNTGITHMLFTITLSGFADGYADVNYATSDGTSRAAIDYTAKNSILTIPPGSTTATITVPVNGDAVYEADETLIVTLSAPSANVTLGTASATGTIINDDIRYMNDTGITTWGDSASNTLTIVPVTSPGQDADYGRDTNPALNSNADGRVGFSFTKLDSSGIPLANQAATYASMPWACVQDNVTGLLWEVKTPGGAGGLRDANHEYSWYNTNGAENGGFSGGANGGVCVDAVNCDTEKYVAAVNGVNLCGYSDWRMPKKQELISIKDYGISASGLAIDVNYFPNMFMAWYWSATPAYHANLVWGVGFKYGDNTGLGIKSWMDHVRLVRGAK